jgi:uncharacterized protein
LDLLVRDWMEICDLDSAKTRAQRLMEVHPLRTADSLQLAAALLGVFDRPRGFEFVTFDDVLARAAEKEGFSVIGSGESA